MRRNLLVLLTKYFIDFMFCSGIIISAGVPLLFRLAGEYYKYFREYYIPLCIIFMASGIFALLILWNLRKMIRTVIKDDPFVEENVISLKRMGSYAFIIASLMAIRLFFAVTPAAMVLVLVFLVAGLFSLVLSQVFDRAVTYKLENDLTI